MNLVLVAEATLGKTFERFTLSSAFPVRQRMAFVAALALLFGFMFAENAQAQLQGSAGNVRVNIVWDEDVDLDLYVTDPCGNRIGYAEFGGGSAVCRGLTGLWDHDDTGHGVRTDNPNAENIVWRDGAPVGGYQVHVSYYERVSSDPANYTIRIFLGDREQPASTHQGAIGPEERRRLRHVTDFDADESVNRPVFSSEISDLHVRQHEPIGSLALPAAIGGAPPLEYDLSPTLPDGLNFNSATRLLSGTPNVSSPQTTYTYTATDSDGRSAELEFSITVEPNEPPVFDNDIADQNYVQNQAIAALTLPAASGDEPITYELSPSPPAGLTFDAATRVLSGTPTAASPASSYTYTATDADEQSASLSFSITVEADEPTVFDDDVADQNYVQNQAIAALTLPAASGDEPITYELSPSPPAGLTFDAATRVLSGTPTAASPASSYTYTATDADEQSASLSFSITVEADEPTVFDDDVADQNYVQNQAIAALTLPAASGDEPITYELSPSPPAGLTFDAATRVLSGTPTAASPASSYTYTATDADGQSASLSFAIGVSAPRGVTLSKHALMVVEDRMGTYTVHLDARPEGSVTVSPRSDNPHITFDPASVTFTSGAAGTVGSWQTPQTIAFEIERENQHRSLTIEHAVSGYGDVTDGGDVTVDITSAPVDTEERQTVQETVAAVAAATVSNVTSNIGARFSAPTGGVSVNLAGKRVAFGPLDTRSSGSILLRDDWNGGDEDPWNARHRVMSGGDLFRSSSFEIALGAAGGNKGGPMDASDRVTVWGRGDFQVFESGGGARAGYDGDLLAGYLGFDLAMDGGWLAGMAVSTIAAEADYTLSDPRGDGALEARLTNVHPYFRVALGQRTEAWAIFGLGTGEITNSTEQGPSETGMSMKMVSAGGRHGLPSIGAIDLAFLVDGSAATVETDDGVQAIDGISASVWRARLGAEVSHTVVWDDGSALTSFLEIAGRKDGGDSAEGEGLEVSPGLAFNHPESGWGLEARGRVLAVHSADNLREHGASITVRKAPGAGNLGLSMAVAPTWGTTDNALNETGANLFSDAAADGRSDSLSLVSRIAYGVAAGRGVLAPFAEFSLRDDDARRIRIGSRYSLGPAVDLELSGDRQDSVFEASKHRMQFSGRIRF